MGKNDIGPIVTLKKDRFSQVTRDGPWVYKWQHEFMHDNELWFYQQMLPYDQFVFPVEEASRDVIRMPYIKTVQHVPSSHAEEFLAYTDKILEALKWAGIRHGDLTKYAVLVQEDTYRPYIIDFSESRRWNDPRKDKRPEGDEYWLRKTMEEYTNERVA